jgi:hypothetical protein
VQSNVAGRDVSVQVDGATAEFRAYLRADVLAVRWCGPPRRRHRDPALTARSSIPEDRVDSLLAVIAVALVIAFLLTSAGAALTIDRWSQPSTAASRATRPVPVAAHLDSKKRSTSSRMRAGTRVVISVRINGFYG